MARRYLARAQDRPRAVFFIFRLIYYRLTATLKIKWGKEEEPMREFVLGVCSCNTKLHGEFNGRQINLGGQRLVVREAIIRNTADDDAFNALLVENRCHAFLDAHHDKSKRGFRWTTDVTLLVTVLQSRDIADAKHSWRFATRRKRPFDYPYNY